MPRVPAASVVEVTLIPDDGGTLLRLVIAAFPTRTERGAPRAGRTTSRGS